MSMVNQMIETAMLTESEPDMHMITKMYQTSLGEGENVARMMEVASDNKEPITVKDIVKQFHSPTVEQCGELKGPVEDIMKVASRLSQTSISIPAACVIIVRSGAQQKKQQGWSRVMCIGGMHGNQYYLIDPASGAMEMSSNLTQEIGNHIRAIFSNTPNHFYEAIFVRTPIAKEKKPRTKIIKEKGKEEEEEEEGIPTPKTETKKVVAPRKRKRVTRRATKSKSKSKEPNTDDDVNDNDDEKEAPTPSPVKKTKSETKEDK